MRRDSSKIVQAPIDTDYRYAGKPSLQQYYPLAHPKPHQAARAWLETTTHLKKHPYP